MEETSQTVISTELWGHHNVSFWFSVITFLFLGLIFFRKQKNMKFCSHWRNPLALRRFLGIQVVNLQRYFQDQRMVNSSFAYMRLTKMTTQLLKKSKSLLLFLQCNDEHIWKGSHCENVLLTGKDILIKILNKISVLVVRTLVILKFQLLLR